MLVLGRVVCLKSICSTLLYEWRIDFHHDVNKFAANINNSSEFSLHSVQYKSNTNSPQTWPFLTGGDLKVILCLWKEVVFKQDNYSRKYYSQSVSMWLRWPSTFWLNDCKKWKCWRLNVTFHWLRIPPLLTFLKGREHLHRILQSNVPVVSTEDLNENRKT